MAVSVLGVVTHTVVMCMNSASLHDHTIELKACTGTVEDLSGTGLLKISLKFEQ